MIVDNFALSQFQACPAKYNLRIRERWTTRRKSAALGFGSAFHSGIAEWYRTGNAKEALEALEVGWPDNTPVDDYRDKSKCQRTLLEYISRYPKENFTVVGFPEDPIIERAFTLPTGMTLDDGEPIEYGGILDGLVDFNGVLYVFEHKTTSQLGSMYFHQFRPNNQVTGYVWGAQQLSGRTVGGAIVNAIGVYKSSATKFERQITTRTQAEIDEWMLSVKATCEAIRTCERTGQWPMHTSACTIYGLCEFHSVHTLPHEQERQKRLEQDYVLSEWGHERRDEKEEGNG